jgi:hypothetical protein
MWAHPHWSVWVFASAAGGLRISPKEVLFAMVEGAREGCGDGPSSLALPLAVGLASAGISANAMRVGAAILLIAAATPTVHIVPCGIVTSRRRTKR